MRKKSARAALGVNFAVLAVAALVWAALASPFSVTAMAGTGRTPVYRGRSENAVALQCVVDWDAAGMEEIAGTLEREGVNMTFAVSCEWAEGHASLLRRLTEAGSEIAVLGPDAESAADIVESVTGVRPRLVYAGGGNGSSGAKGLIPVMSTADLNCGMTSAEGIVRNAGKAASPGSILSVSPTAEFVKALPELIKKIKNMGFDIVPTYKMLYN